MTERHYSAVASELVNQSPSLPAISDCYTKRYVYSAETGRARQTLVCNFCTMECNTITKFKKHAKKHLR